MAKSVEKLAKLSEYYKRKYERTKAYNKYVKYWVQTDCIACNGSGYYDSDGSPYCEGCEGTGKEWYKPEYEKAETDVELLIGKTLVLHLSGVEDLFVYVNKRREVIYQYDNLADPINKKRIRARLKFGYSPDGNYQDWNFEDINGKRYYLKEFNIQKT